MKVADLHCDLLSYLEEAPNRRAEDPQSRTSILQLQQGGVVLQVLAVFTTTKAKSSEKGDAQFRIFQELPGKYGRSFSEEICPVLAIENASSFCDELESLEKGLKRVEAWWKKVGHIAYLSFTWNGENRFGGGNASKAGIKPDGIEMLKWMDGKKIAIDLSHTSDALAEDILNEIDKNGLEITPVASHSNFRAILDHPRNLPDRIALEIFKRKGVMGLNFVRPFLGMDGPGDFIRHVEHAKELDGMDSFCFGADFCYDADASPELEHLRPFYQQNYDNSSCYPRLLDLLHSYLSKHQLKQLSHKNALRFLKPAFMGHPNSHFKHLFDE